MLRLAVINAESGQVQHHCNIPEQHSQCGNRHIGRARLEVAVDMHEHVTTQLFGAVGRCDRTWFSPAAVNQTAVCRIDGHHRHN